MQPIDIKKDETKMNTKYLMLKNAGFPMITGCEEKPIIKNKELFEKYVKEQWIGMCVKKGDYLFDKYISPGFAFKAVIVEPENSIIDESTVILLEEEIVDEIDEEIEEDFKKEYRIKFSDVIGQKSAKSKCSVIKMFLQDPDKFGDWAPKNILFYGPSGTGKTMLAKALVSETNAEMVCINATSLIGGFVGEGSSNIHRLYDYAEKNAPCIIFIDEIDAIALDRRYQELRGDVSEIVNALITEMDGIKDRRGVCLIAATNLPNVLDNAIKNRFEEEIEFTLPNFSDRLEILKRYMKTYPIPFSDKINLKKFARYLEGYSGRDIVEKVLKVALHRALINDEKEVKEEHLISAFNDSEIIMKKKRNLPANNLYR
ncbi:AAA family ATPase [Candidatus Methanoliparum sp. LAM-1]|nr:AAA family ATPase [Candidatus Methanoliparum sp. LAM-1]BDC36525.1 ATPase AAA [Candidatus Methanoliparum sp. LAM-1]